ncbi:histidine kinase [Dinoroseobacter shibae DFL 12 = DSM 16493]|uniref:histidine kinase n=2 Tax=Dinoroseobacter shibae TaxID=215813 RepID=A8LKV1_DINSH|nr:histidine kinase [Dinoroseobacter shibae DFL 12 = DSM 16493]
MRAVTGRYLSRWVTRYVSLRNLQTWTTLGMVALGPILAIATFLVLGPLDQGQDATTLRVVILADFVYVLILAALVLQRVARMIAARRARSAGSRLHLRLTGVFAIVALVPTVLVAVFATITVNFGLEGWFSDRVQRVLGASLAAAEAYEEEQRVQLQIDTAALASYLDRARAERVFLSDGDLRQLLAQGQSSVQRGLREAYIVNANGDIRIRGERSYLFDFERPTPDQIAASEQGTPIVIEDWTNNEFRALVKLARHVDRYLYVSREVDGEILTLLDDTQETVQLFRQLESDRGQLLFDFGLLYIGFAVILIIASIWLGLWFAERLSRPVGRLAGAAQRVGAGDLDVKVPEQQGDDEIAMLGRLFNQMTRQLKAQREALLENTNQIERRRRLFDSVLGSVTAGVIGLDSRGRVDFMNRSATAMLALDGVTVSGRGIDEVVPEFEDLFDKLQGGLRDVAQQQVSLTRQGRQESLLVRIAKRLNREDRLEGYVVAFDDVTDLATAQRMAAWGDVARRIAHEIKNPLTPIQLSAERMKRKFGPRLGEDGPALVELSDVIIRQTADLRRIVDEFSKFARMPEPETAHLDLAQLVRDAVLLQQVAQPDVTFVTDISPDPVPADLDATLMGQALTNLLKNAGEAIESRQTGKTGDTRPGEIRVSLRNLGREAELTIADNGIGLPPDTAKLFEPYVTTRDKGTGLGLPIVRKIVEEHQGTLELRPAEPFTPDTPPGAAAVILLPTRPPDPEAATQVDASRPEPDITPPKKTATA